MIANLSLDEMVAFINEALKMEYDCEAYSVKNATQCLKTIKKDVTEITIRGMVGNKIIIFDVYYDDKWVGVNWMTQISTSNASKY